MKYKVGDKVRVRKDLEADKWYGDDSVVSEMLQMRGKEVTISQIINSEYKLLEDFGGWSWTDEMFEPKCDRKILITSDGVETLARLYDGDKVVKTKTAKCSPEDVFDFATGAKLAFERLMGEDKPKQAIPKFKVGDKVKFTGFCACCRNTTATIIRQGDRGLWIVDNGKEGLHCLWHESVMELCAEDKPEVKPEPVKSDEILLYCVKGYKPGEWLTKGKTYAQKDGRVTMDDGYITTRDDRGLEGKTLDSDGVHCFDDVNKHFSAQFIPFVEDKPSFDWAGFKRRDFAVNCDTKEKAKAFLAECYQHGLFWSDRDVRKTKWGVHEANTCYSFSLGTLGYTEKSWYKKQGIKVIPYR